MKFISKHGKSEKDIKNLRQEIGILRKLNRENIFLMFDAFETDREFCVVTEYAPGELFEILQDDQRLPEAVVQKKSRRSLSRHCMAIYCKSPPIALSVVLLRSIHPALLSYLNSIQVERYFEKKCSNGLVSLFQNLNLS